VVIKKRIFAKNGTPRANVLRIPGRRSWGACPGMLLTTKAIVGEKRRQKLPAGSPGNV